MRRAPGFTLIELLAALAVLAVLATLSFRGLSSVLDAEAHVREEARRWDEAGLLLAQLREDVFSSTAIGSVGEGQLVLERFGELPGMPPRRVEYRLRDGAVEYLAWSAVPEAHAVLGGVAELSFTALREDGSWTPAWPPAAALPRAIAVELVLARGERITRLYPLP
jgi:prepilin-type N-terminal cleavage/methylation domain-containing protein